MSIFKNTLVLFTALFIASCSDSSSTIENNSADLVISGGTIYTLNDKQATVEAVAVRNGKIQYTGSKQGLQPLTSKHTKVIDLKGQTMIPGFIEGHGHLMGLGYELSELNLSTAQNYDDIVSMVKTAVQQSKPGEWILGNSWHQSKWNKAPVPEVHGFQTNAALNAVSPNNPVMLKHASGHALFANDAALTIAGVNNETVSGDDGEVIKDSQGKPTGILTENAQNLIFKVLPVRTQVSNSKALTAAMQHLAEHGITSFHDAGAEAAEIETYQTFADNKQLSARLYLMIAGWDSQLLDHWLSREPIIDPLHWLTIRSIKLSSDGALGSRGAWLVKPYSDRPGHVGNPTMSMEDVLNISQRALDSGYQMAVHAIGDRANREVLDQFEITFMEADNIDLAKQARFRIEHAQHLQLDDIPRFADLGVIASMQGIHMSSDRPWAIDRLGKKRIEEGAYVWRKLADSGAIIVNGTDVPVEPINPLASYYALVTRQTLAGTPEGGYEPDQKLTRMEALKSYTLDAAYGAFEEDIKGSIEVEKLADFTILSDDLTQIPGNEILDIDVTMTIVNGKVVYSK